MKKLSLAILLFILASSIFADNNITGTYTYKVENKKDNSIERTHYKVSTKDGKIIVDLVSRDNTWTAVQDGMFTTDWRFDSKEISITISTDRTKKTLTSHTKYKKNNKTRDKTVKIEEDIPFLNCFEFGLIPFILDNSKKETAFYAFRADNGELIKMIAKKQGIEKVNAAGRISDAEKVEITLAGWLSAFWKATYWYDKKTGVLLEFKGTIGPPGSPELHSMLEKIE